MSISLDDIRAEAERRYGDLVVDMPGGTVRFRAFLRLPEHARTAFVAYEREFRGLADTDQPGTDASAATADAADAGRLLDLMRDMLAVTADRPEVFTAAVAELDDGPAVVAMLWEHYQGTTQPGEALRSAG